MSCEGLKSMSEIVSSPDYMPSTESMNSTRDQMKLFILAQAKSQLSKVLELNDKLDIWINKYTEKVDERMKSPDITPDEIASYMSQIVALIDRSNKMIQSVIGDEKLVNLMYLDMSNNVTNNNSADVVTTSEIDGSPVSRSRIRTAVSNIISVIDSYTEKPESDIEENTESNDQ